LVATYCKKCNADCCKRGSIKHNGERIKLNPCTYLDSELSRCKIYNKRPEACKMYPIRKATLGEKDIVIIMGNCRAVSDGVINKHIQELEQTGIKIYQ